MQDLIPRTSSKLANMGFLCSIFVVIIHIWSPSEVSSPAWWFYSATSMRSIAVPFFFLMSGYLLAGHIGEPDWWKRENLKRVRSLVVPYVAWGLLWLLFLLLLKFTGNVIHDRWCLTGFRSLLCSHKFMGFDLFSHPQLPTLWYVRSLIIFVFLSPIFMWALNKHLWLVMSLALVKLFLYRGECSGTCYYLIDRMFSFGFIFYFLLGMALRKSLIKIQRKNYTLLVGLSAITIWCIIHFTYASGETIQSPRILRFIFGRLHTLDTMLWMYFIWIIMPSKKLPQLFANTSFGIYLVHWFILDGLWQPYILGRCHTIMDLILSFCVGVGGSLVFVITLKTLFPKTAALLFGGR